MKILANWQHYYEYVNILVNMACQFWRNILLWLFPRKGKVLWVAFIEAGVAHCCASVVRPPPLGEQLDIGLGFVFKQLNTFDKKTLKAVPASFEVELTARLILFNVIWTDLRSRDNKFYLNCLLAVQTFWEKLRALLSSCQWELQICPFNTFWNFFCSKLVQTAKSLISSKAV